MFFTKVITILKINDALKRDQIHVFLEVMLVIDFFKMLVFNATFSNISAISW
jgi:hypothetical protein